MKYRKFTTWFSFMLLSFTAFAQQGGWPLTLRTVAGTEVKVYEPTPESYSGNLLKLRAAVSEIPQGKTDPVFGVLWADVTTRGEGTGNIAWQNVAVTNLNIPGETDKTALSQLASAIENIPANRNISMTSEELQTKLNAGRMEKKLAQNLNTTPPKIIYKKKKSILVLVDGQPDLQSNTDWGVKQVVNTPFTIVQNPNGQFYLYGDKKWYSADAVTGPWYYAEQLPGTMSVIDRDVRANDTSQAVSDGIAEIVVSTEPAELIQSNGEANFSLIEGTNLLYMTNSANDIFHDIKSQQYYVLISGRWYNAPGLGSAWTYIPAESLPADFAAIPEGSAKGNVLASVAGTSAANASVMEAQLPQTAKVDRNNATASVMYDGEPKFENIDGTGLKYAVNTPGSVLNQGRSYYYVENGVWFESYSANGPWKVATQRPVGVENIPPSYPVYNVKYVYIYDATPDYVYMGYTPGYLGTYIYGPTIVYGTGYYYRPWRGRYYYPRPLTWGFSMRYAPWLGWGFSIGINPGWFYLNSGYYRRGSCWGGWWGPAVYRPPYYGYYNSYGYNYGRYNNGYNNYAVINRTNNVYRYRRDVVTYEQPRYANNRGMSRDTRVVRDNSGRYNNGYNDNNGYNNVPGQRNGLDNGNSASRNYDPNQRQGGGVNGRNADGGFPSRTNNGAMQPSAGRNELPNPDFRRGNGFPSTDNRTQPSTGQNGLPGPDVRRSNNGFPSRTDNGAMQPSSGQNGLPGPDVRRRDNGFPSRGDNGSVQPAQEQNGLPSPDIRRNGDGNFPGGRQGGRVYNPGYSAPNNNRDMNQNSAPVRTERPAFNERSQESRAPVREFQRVQPTAAPRQQQERPAREGSGNSGSSDRGSHERSSSRRGG